ncbi:MAG: rod shape-determining protein MreD [Alphaproteobacteria bacterium]
MTPSLAHTIARLKRAEPIRRYLFPTISTFVLLLAEPILSAATANQNAIPTLGLCALIYWAGNREARIPYWIVFFLGLLADSFHGTPLGLYAAIFITAQASTRGLTSTLNIQHFNTKWILASAVILISALLVSIGVAVLSPVPRPLPDLWIQSLATLAVYPIIASILSLASDSHS